MDTVEGQEFHIFTILFIILVAIFFIHSIARTCMLATRVVKYGTTLHRVPSIAGPRGYAQPAEPIRVILARDEELVGQDPGPSQIKVTAPPPAYGLWRNSVVCFLSCCSYTPRYSVSTDKYHSALTPISSAGKKSRQPRQPKAAAAAAVRASPPAQPIRIDRRVIFRRTGWTM